MSNKSLVRLIGGLLLVSLAACSFAPATAPLPTETPTTVSPSQTPSPVPSPTILVTTIVTTPINGNNIDKLVSTQRAAVSNIQSIVWSPDSSSLVLVTQNTDAENHEVFGFTSLKASDLSTRSVFTSVGNRIAAVANDGKTVAIIDASQKAFSIVDASRGSSSVILANKSTDFLIQGISFSPDLRFIAVTKADNWEVVLYDFSTFEQIKVLTGFETAAPVFDARFDASPQWLVWHSRGIIQLQDVGTDELKGVLSHMDFVSSYVLSPDGTILASSAGKTVNGVFQPVISIWDTNSSTEVKTLLTATEPTAGNVGYANALAFSPDGKLLAAAVGKDIQLWDPAAGTLLTTLSGHTDSILKLAFSPDQKSIASAGLDNQLFLWQVPQ